MQNVTQGAMIMEKMNLLPADTFRCRDMSICDDGTSVFDSVLQPQDVRQYLYVLESTTLASRSTTALGKLDIAWRTAFGEVGRLQTSMMQRKLPTAATLEQAVVFSVLDAAPGEVEVPMTVQCRVRNVSPTARTVCMCLNEEQPVANVANTALHIIGDARRALGTLQPGASVDFSLDVLPLSTGLQRVAGLQLMDVAAATGERCDVDLTCFIGGAEDMLAR